MPIYDLECMRCERVQETIAEYNTTGLYSLVCSRCGRETVHKRLPSLFAPYMGERVFNPMVSGGKFDTTGNAKVTRLPKFKDYVEHDARVEANIKRLSPGAGKEEVRAAVRAAGPGPSMADWRDHLRKPEVKEAKRQRAEDVRRNKLKRARAGAIARGENINLRRDKLPGDPKVTG